MKRRTFLQVVAGMVAVAFAPLARAERPGMRHLYWNGEGETVAANSLEEAARFHDCEMAGKAEPDNDWEQIDDDDLFTINDYDSDGRSVTKSAGEWAAECREVTQVASTYA